MELVPVEAPAAGLAATREAPELLDAPLRIVAPRQPLEVVADDLVEALAQRRGLLAGPGHQLLVEGQGEVHVHSIRAHVTRVNGPAPAPAHHRPRPPLTTGPGPGGHPAP